MLKYFPSVFQLHTHPHSCNHTEHVIMDYDHCVYHSEQSENCRGFEHALTNTLKQLLLRKLPWAVCTVCLCVFECVRPINWRGEKAWRTCMNKDTWAHAGLSFSVCKKQDIGLTLLYFSHFSLFKLLSFYMVFISQVQITCFHSVMAAITKKHYKHSTSNTTKLKRRAKPIKNLWEYKCCLALPEVALVYHTTSESWACRRTHGRSPTPHSMLAEPLLQFPSFPSGFVWKYFVLSAAYRLYKGPFHCKRFCVICLHTY